MIERISLFANGNINIYIMKCGNILMKYICLGYCLFPQCFDCNTISQIVVLQEDLEKGCNKGGHLSSFTETFNHNCSGCLIIISFYMSKMY